MHLVVEWVPMLEEWVGKMAGKGEVNSRFRLWLSSVEVDGFPQSILQRSVKVCLQPPTYLSSYS